MVLEIQPHSPINKASFRLGGHYLGKIKSRNFFITNLNNKDRFFTTWIVLDGQKKQIKTLAESRKADKVLSRTKAYIEDHLTDEGAKLFRKIYDTLGAFDFCFYIDDPLPAIHKKIITIDDLVEGYIIEIGPKISVLK